MYSKGVFLLVLLLERCFGTIPEDMRREKIAFKVPRTPKPGSVSNGPAAKRKLFRKFGWTISTASEALNDTLPFRTYINVDSAKKTGKVSATPAAFHSEYFCAVTIGGQTLSLDFDTGSSDLWVFSTYLSSEENAGHTPFDPSKSPTFQNASDEAWAISYGDGSAASGVVGFDAVTIGGPTVTRQAVELATAISAEFEQDTDSDGIFGLGFSRINTVQPDRQKTWFSNIKHQLKSPVFTADLNEDGSGFYQFGVVDRSQVQGNLTKVPVDPSNGFWQFSSPVFALNGEPVFNVNASPAIADTGTSLIIVDDNVASYYYGRVEGAQYSDYYNGWIYPCETASTIPSFGVSLGSSDFIVTIPSNLITYGPVDEDFCYGGIQGNSGYQLQIYGDLLFRSSFVAFQDFRGVAGTSEFLGLSVGLKA